MGVVECVKHGVLNPYPVMFEREGAELAHFKFTALLLPGGTLKVAGLNVPGTLASDKSRTFLTRVCTCARVHA